MAARRYLDRPGGNYRFDISEGAGVFEAIKVLAQIGYARRFGGDIFDQIHPAGDE